MTCSNDIVSRSAVTVNKGHETLLNVELGQLPHDYVYVYNDMFLFKRVNRTI